MRPAWDAVNARARGLGTHLLDRRELELMAAAPDAAALVDHLRRLGISLPDDGARLTLEALELAVRRAAAAQLRTLARWCGGRGPVLVIVFEDEDRRSLRALIRGAAQGADAARRLSGLIPTPGLPERALQELARQPTPGAVAALLSAWRHPYGPPLLPEAAAAHPDLLRLEVSINRRFVERAQRDARAGGGSARHLLGRYLRDLVDVENAMAALVLSAGDTDVPADEAFLRGGARVDLTVFRRAAAASGSAAAARILAAAFAPPLAAAFRAAAQDTAGVEAATLRILIRELMREQRHDPLGPAPVLRYALRVRAQVLDLHRVIWGVALRTPPARLSADLVAV